MEVKVQLHFDNERMELSKWRPPPRDKCQQLGPVTSPNRSVQLNNCSPNRLDYAIGDKIKLLQLADRIQTRKTSGSNCTPGRNNKTQDYLVPTPPRRCSSIITPRRRLSEDDWIETSTVEPSPEPLLHKVGSSFRRSKFYASFSPKKRSFQKLVKSDPAKTNIEHLVNRNIHRDPFLTPKVNDCKVKPTVQQVTTDFHDNVKLSSIFSPTIPPPGSRSRKSQPKNQKPSIYLDCENTKGRAGFTFCNLSPGIQSPEFRAITPETLPQVSVTGSDRLMLDDLTCRYGSCDYDEIHQIPTVVDSNPEGCSMAEQNSNLVGNQSCELSRNHESLTTLVSHGNYETQIGAESPVTIGNEKSQAKRRSLETNSNQVLSNSTLLPHPLQEQAHFWGEVGSEKLKSLESRRMSHMSGCGRLQEIPTTPLEQRTASPAKMGSDKREGRPMSLDYGQRKAWLKAIGSSGDMDESPAEAPVKRSSKPKSKRPLSITHLHLVEAEPLEESPETSSLGSGTGDGSSTKSSSSIFQRFSKTFSLRFGISGTSSKTRVPCGSSPDIVSLSTGIESNHRKNGTDPHRTETRKKKKSVDPSSGKVRKRVSTSYQREDKCQSGDSGIQLAEDDPRSHRVLLADPLDHHSTGWSQVEENPPRRPSDVSFASLSPMSMKKLTLVELPHDGRTEDDAGFISATEDETEEERILKNGAPLPSSYFHSLPLKYSRQRKADLVAEKRATVRKNVVKEFLTTEANYVKSLNDIVQGFVFPCRARSDLFNDKTVSNIFSNVEDLLSLHARILERLQSAIGGEECTSEARIGHIFIEWAGHFDLYSEYCYQNPMSMATVRLLCLNREYADFFEACRRLQLMDKLPLHGFLLRPIQRICQYHLQLNELLKNTPPTHEDYTDVETALRTMKDVAMRMNDTQRKFDSLQEIVRIQSSIDAWEGVDLVPGSCAVLIKGDLIKTSPGHKPKEVNVILLNNEILICRKDYYKKGTTSLAHRIPLCSTPWVDITEEDEYFGAVQNSWRIFSLESDPPQWILLTAPSPAEKKKWMNSFEASRNPFPVDLKMSEMAKFTALKLMLTESQQPSFCNASFFNSASSLPRLRKNRKNSSLTKSDSDAMLIEVGKLRKSSQFPYKTNQITQIDSPRHNQTPTSKFYV